MAFYCVLIDCCVSSRKHTVGHILERIDIVTIRAFMAAKCKLNDLKFLKISSKLTFTLICTKQFILLRTSFDFSMQLLSINF